MNNRPTLGQRSADNVAAFLGSWRFIIGQSLFLTFWILWNIFAPHSLRFDPYPFIFLNLMLSFQAAYSAPIITMNQNRQAEVDRQRQIEDYDVDKKAETEVEDIQQHLHNLEDNVTILLEKLGYLHENQAEIMKMQTLSLIPAHEQHRMLDESVWYPEHEDRTESPLFRKNKEILRKQDAPCFICGVRASEGAEIEIHHLLEWAFKNGIDMERVNSDFDVSDIEDIKMLMPLCKKHHRGKNTGIHNLSHPIWLAQKYAKEGFSFTEHPAPEMHMKLMALYKKEDSHESIHS